MPKNSVDVDLDEDLDSNPLDEDLDTEFKAEIKEWGEATATSEEPIKEDPEPEVQTRIMAAVIHASNVLEMQRIQEEEERNRVNETIVEVSSATSIVGLVGGPAHHEPFLAVRRLVKIKGKEVPLTFLVFSEDVFADTRCPLAVIRGGIAIPLSVDNSSDLRRILEVVRWLGREEHFRDREGWIDPSNISEVPLDFGGGRNEVTLGDFREHASNCMHSHQVPSILISEKTEEEPMADGPMERLHALVRQTSATLQQQWNHNSKSRAMILDEFLSRVKEDILR